MRPAGLLHPELLRIVASMGHGQLLCIGDAGLPVPQGVPAVQLGVAPGVPAFLDVLDAVLGELVVEAATVADELTDAALTDALRARLDSIEVSRRSHDGLKAMTRECVAVVRTGECTPFANVVLRAGVAF